MASTQVDVSEKALLDLAEKIDKTIKMLKKYNDELNGDLKHLGKSFRDEGYATVQSYVAKAERLIEDNIPNTNKVAKGLIDYARIVRASRTKI